MLDWKLTEFLHHDVWGSGRLPNCCQEFDVVVVWSFEASLPYLLAEVWIVSNTLSTANWISMVWQSVANVLPVDVHGRTSTKDRRCIWTDLGAVFATSFSLLIHLFCVRRPPMDSVDSLFHSRPHPQSIRNICDSDWTRNYFVKSMCHWLQTSCSGLSHPKSSLGRQFAFSNLGIELLIFFHSLHSHRLRAHDFSTKTTFSTSLRLTYLWTSIANITNIIIRHQFCRNKFHPLRNKFWKGIPLGWWHQRNAVRLTWSVWTIDSTKMGSNERELERNDPCWKVNDWPMPSYSMILTNSFVVSQERQIYYKCLLANDFDQEKCKLHQMNSKNCKDFWVTNASASRWASQFFTFCFSLPFSHTHINHISTGFSVIGCEEE